MLPNQLQHLQHHQHHIKNNSVMHCYIDGDSFESKMGTKFETPYSNVSNAYIPNIWNDLENFFEPFLAISIQVFKLSIDSQWIYMLW